MKGMNDLNQSTSSKFRGPCARSQYVHSYGRTGRLYGLRPRRHQLGCDGYREGARRPPPCHLHPHNHHLHLLRREHPYELQGDAARFSRERRVQGAARAEGDNMKVVY